MLYQELIPSGSVPEVLSHAIRRRDRLPVVGHAYALFVSKDQCRVRREMAAESGDQSRSCLIHLSRPTHLVAQLLHRLDDVEDA